MRRIFADNQKNSFKSKFNKFMSLKQNPRLSVLFPRHPCSIKINEVVSELPRWPSGYPEILPPPRHRPALAFSLFLRKSPGFPQ